jgi:glycerol-3-phosphate dehydrogenase
MNRDDLIKNLKDRQSDQWDVIVIGGGATGRGVALDAVTRGYKTLLLEQSDFTKGTSSRSTKLVHGGVRYMAQGDILLVIEALHERGLMLSNAPHLTANQEFIIPAYTLWDVFLYTV